MNDDKDVKIARLEERMKVQEQRMEGMAQRVWAIALVAVAFVVNRVMALIGGGTP
jgi:hypothetical protein